MLHLSSTAGEYLFSGTKRELKHYIRKNKISNYKITSGFPGQRKGKPEPIDIPVTNDPPVPPVVFDPEEEVFNTIFEDE